MTDFDAYALPAALSARDPAHLEYDEPGVRVRYVDADPAWLRALTGELKEAAGGLAARSAESIAETLGVVGERFGDPFNPLRTKALALLPATSGLSAEMAAAVLDGMASDWTRPRLSALLRSELGDPRVLDDFAPATEGARVMAFGPRLCVQIVAGSVPGVGVTALIRSLLVKAPTLLKPGRGDVVLPTLFARALREADPGLADALAVVYWPGGRPELDGAVLAAADVVAAYGADETVAALRRLVPVTARFVGYHHRVSVGIVGREALRDPHLGETAGDVARAVALFDHGGCVSPQLVFVEGDSEVAEAFGTGVARELDLIEQRWPSGRLDEARASALHQMRGTAELLAAAGEAAVIHGGAAPWTVIVGPESAGVVPGTGRVVRVRAVRDAVDVTALLVGLSPHLQTVGVAGLGARLEDIARALGAVGASRVVPFPSVAFPPPWWHHDGRGPLTELVRWVDLET